MKKIGFIGAGNMAEAIIKGLIKNGTCKPEWIFVADKSDERIEYIKRTTGVTSLGCNKDVFDSSEIVVLAVKPQTMGEILDEIRPDNSCESRKIIISIAAGIRTDFIENKIYSSIEKGKTHLFPVSRVMPNTPGLAGAGMTGVCINSTMSDQDASLVTGIFTSMGKTIICKESEMDAVTAMSGSGPAYVFYFMESMINAGKTLGFSDEASRLLTIETFKGAIKLMETQNEAPESLRKKVTSPGGTTEAAIRHMENKGVKAEISRGIIAAAERSDELSRALSA